MFNFKNTNIFFIFIALFLLLNSKEPLSSLLLLFLLWLSMIMLGSLNIRWNYYIESESVQKNTHLNRVALTFDDGPNIQFTPQVLKLLKRYNAKATFFCIGENIQYAPQIFQQILDEGHSVGNHSFSHSTNFGFFSQEAVEKEIYKTQKLVETKFQITMKLFRPPFGVTNPNIAKGIKSSNLRSIGWSVRSFDTAIKNPKFILKYILPQIQKGKIILMHDNNQNSIKLLELLLIELEKQKFELVTVENLLNYTAITKVKRPETIKRLSD